MTIARPGGPFNRPTNLAVAPSGDLYISDGYGNCRVHQFSPRGELRRSWGVPGTGPGQFHLPHGIGGGRRWARLRLRPRERPHPDLQPGRRVPRRVDRHPAAHPHRVRRAGPRLRLRAVVAPWPDLPATRAHRTGAVRARQRLRHRRPRARPMGERRCLRCGQLRRAPQPRRGLSGRPLRRGGDLDVRGESRPCAGQLPHVPEVRPQELTGPQAPPLRRARRTRMRVPA